MRRLLAFCLVAGGCVTETPNPPPPIVENRPIPRVIGGGGIGDGAINGVVNLYVIDDASRRPVAGAAVQIGAMIGATDASGLFVAAGVAGPQTVIAKASGYRSEVWVGVNGANVTIDLAPAVIPDPGRADISGQITGFANVVVPAGHVRVGAVTYAQSDLTDDNANQLTTFANANVCVVSDPAAGCSFTITSRTGRIGLMAAIMDVDTRGTASSDDDVSTVIGWAYRGGVTVTDKINQSAVDLTVVSGQAQASVDFGMPPGSLTKVQGVIGVETADGVYQLPVVRTPADAGSFMVPALTEVGATGYRLSAVAQTALGAFGEESAVILRGQASPVLTATWMQTPTGVAVSRTRMAWDGVPGATVSSVEYTQGLLPVTHLLNVAVFDGSTSVVVPDAVALPTGAMSAKLTALGATGLDVGSFGLDADRDKLDHVVSVPILVP